jgi:hypothetical protein
MGRRSRILLYALLFAMELSPATAQSLAPAPLADDLPLRFAQYRQCSQRAGPFATQTTAWQRWREARNRGLSVSNGVVPCYWGDTRGYCFNIFHSC